jgi:hypothetical protein
MTSETIQFYRRVDGFDCSEVPDGYVIYDHGREQVHFLNLTAAAVLELCDGRNSVETISEVLRDAFALATSPKADIEACLAWLVSQGMVESCSQSSSVA